MEEIFQEIKELKRRVYLLESRKVLCYETILSDPSDISIESILGCKQDLSIQMCDYVLKYNVLQLINKNHIYICHKGSWIKGNTQELNDLFTFVENKWIGAYIIFLKDEISGEQFEKYNNIIYSLNLKKNLNKMKEYIIESIKK